MKLHIGADKRGIVHTVTATNAAAAVSTQPPYLLHGQEREVFGDQAYWKEADRQAFGSARSALPDQSATRLQAAERTLADDQPRPLADPGARRASLSGPQAAVGLQQSEVPRLGQEPGAGAHHVCPGQSLPSPPQPVAERSELRLVRSAPATRSFGADHRRANHHPMTLR